MRANWRVLTAGAVLAASMGQAPVQDALTRARLAYNARQFDAALGAAREAMRDPASSNAAAVVLGLVHLERYRASAEAPDLDGARAALAQVRPDLLPPRDHVDFLMGLGVALFLDGCSDGCFGGAAEFFGQALDADAAPALGERETIFEWWAGALDRQAQFGPDEQRWRIYERLLDRAERERSRFRDSTSAAYWTAAAARGAGDFDRAWGAAIAGWVRARYLGEPGAKLRADLDRFVTDVLLPERAKQLIPDADPRPMLAQLRGEWEGIKGKYK